MLAPVGLLIVCAVLIGLAARFASAALYGYLVRAGYAHAYTIRVISFIAIVVGICCILGFIFLATFRLER